MALNEILPVVGKAKKGGGILGSVIGGIAGALAGLATTAASANPGAGIAAGLGTATALSGAGATAGGLIGEGVAPSKGAEASATVPISKSAPQKKPMQALQDNPEIKLATLQNAKNLTKSSDLPNEDAMAYMKMFEDASGKLKNQMGIG